MTQEELDALMNGELDAFEDMPQEDDAQGEDAIEDDISDLPPGYSEKTAHHWPLPATDENKMVHQLDDVTKEGEEKASQIFDIIEGISNDLMEKEDNLQRVVETFEKNIELFSKLHEKFPNVEAFGTSLELNQNALEDANLILETFHHSGDSIMNVMDIMQYQDIHRQKIERVINVMRALSKYMNALFEGKIDDDKRVASATHIVGDTHNELATNDDIEALLEQFASKG
ncbi:MAG: chemotaxis protein [Thiovulaceae bacterium]|nr:chemotaxis protein [Sulfurimonadaceae bacterium]